MSFYILNLALLIIYGMFLLWKNPSLQNKKVFCVMAASQWILLSGLRDSSIGADTYIYKLYYETIAGRTWSGLCNNFINVIFKGASGKDPGYMLFEKLVQIFTTNYQVYLIIIAMIFTISLGVWIYKNSEEPLMSFLIYSCLFYSFFAITGHRQTIATALVVFIGYKFIKERKFWPFLILVALATTIHKSAISFLPFYFLANIKITKKYLFIMSVITIALFIFRNQVMLLLGNFMGYEQYVDQYEGAGAWTFTALLIVLYILVIWKYDVMIINNIQTTNYINALLMALVFVPLTFVDPNAMRVVQYYSIFIMLLVPEIIKTFTPKEKTFAYYVAATILIVLFVKTNPQYLFFWQG